MKIVHISYSDKKGGAAIAAFRHHESLLKAGFNSSMLVLDKISDAKTIEQYKPSFINKWLPKIMNRFVFKVSRYYATWSCSLLGNDLSKNSLVSDADVIILHWVNLNTLSLSSISKILKTGKPVYWFMHDMWPITGGCHHSFNCTKFTTHCQACPLYDQNTGSKKVKDLSYWQFENKIKYLSNYTNLIFMTPSKWLAELVKKSSIFNSNKVEVIRNVLDTNEFVIKNKVDSRKRLGLPQDKKLLLFGADNISSPYKGWTQLQMALKDSIKDVEAVVYGSTPANLQSQLGIKIHTVGHITDTSKLVDLYNSCDLFVTPSLADNYPNVLIEAMACGLPCVGTNVGGIPEIITSKTGKLVKADCSDLRKTIIEELTSNQCTDRSNIRSEIVAKNSYNQGLVKYFRNSSEHK